MYLAKWQETDVAVKVITQMQNLSPCQGVYHPDPGTMQLQPHCLRSNTRRPVASPFSDKGQNAQGEHCNIPHLACCRLFFKALTGSAGALCMALLAMGSKFEELHAPALAAPYLCCAMAYT